MKAFLGSLWFRATAILGCCLLVVGVVAARAADGPEAARAALAALPPGAADSAHVGLGLTSFSRLAELGSDAAPMVRARGIVMANALGVFLTDTETNLLARGALPEGLRAGDILELVGVPERNVSVPELRVVGAWKLGTAPRPPPVPASVEQLAAATTIGQFVELTGRVVGLVPAPTQQNCVLEQGGRLVLVMCPGEAPLSLEVGSEVRARGVFAVRRDREGRVAALTLHLDSREDFEMTDPPPFWNRARLGTAATILLVLLGAGLAWLWLLRRQVAAQTRTLRERFDRMAEMERLHGAVFSSLAEGIIVVDAAGRIIEANPAAEKIVGVSARRMTEMIAGRNGMTVFHPDGRPIPPEAFPVNVTLRTGQPVSGLVAGLDREDGRRVWLSISSRPLLKPDGPAPAGAVSSFQDITEQVGAEAESSRLEGQLRHAQKMKALGTLAGGVAHDFNNLLGVILGNTSMARSELTPGHPAMPFVEETLRASHRAADVVRQILAFSRKKDTQRAVADLRPVVAEAAGLLRTTIPSCVEIDCAMPEPVPPVLCAASEIHQVVMNLGTNAWHALEGKPGRIEIRLSLAADLSDVRPRIGRLEPVAYVRLSVRDTGAGVDEAVAERMFEPFFTTKPAGEGTGLGLAVVHGIVESHGGAIGLESAPGRGTCFDIYLPASTQPLPEVESGSPASPVSRGEAVLVVDDEPGVARTVHLMLERQGYAAEYVTAPQDALDRLRNRPGHFRLLVTDLSMPVLTGCQLAMEARQLQPDLVVILMTGYGTDLKPQHLREAGIAEMVLKPFSPDMLAETLHRVLAGRGS